MTSSRPTSLNRIIRPQDWEAIRLYSNIPKATEATQELEKRAIEALLRYLIRYRVEFGKITLRGVSRGLGLSYSKARRLLKKLVDDEIVIRWPIGKSVAFLVADLEKAIMKGYISLERDELHLLSILSSIGELEEQIGSTILAIPKILVFPKLYAEGMNVLSESWLASIEASHYLLALRKKEPPPKISPQALNLVKHYKEFEDFERAVGQVPLTTIPVYRSIVIPGMKDVLGEIRRELGVTGELKVKLKNLHPMAYGILMRELFFELDCNENPTKQEVREALRRLAEKQLKLLLYIEKPLLEKLRKGVFDEFSAEAVIYEATVLRLASVFALNLGADMRLVKRARMAAEILEKAAEELRRRNERTR